MSALRDDGARAVVCGPYETHEAALADVFAVETFCDPWRRYAWGTCSSGETLAVWLRPDDVTR